MKTGTPPLAASHIMKLRQTLEDDPSRPTHFRTYPVSATGSPANLRTEPIVRFATAETNGAGPNGLAPWNAHRSGFSVLSLELATENFHSRELHRNRATHRYVRYRLPGSGGQKQGAALGH